MGTSTTLSNSVGMDTHLIGTSGFSFSAKRIGDLTADGASEYTLVTIAVDATGSVDGFQGLIERCLENIVVGCRQNPRADSVMLRVMAFNTSIGVHEIHGFKPLADCNPADYTGKVRPQGATNLIDASFSAAGGLNQYGKELRAKDYDCNGIFVVITDGEDNASKVTTGMLKAELDRSVRGEILESCVSILIGVNAGASGACLQTFQADVGFNQYVAADNASPATFAKIAGFVSKSISAQSQMLGTGGPSKALTF